MEARLVASLGSFQVDGVVDLQGVAIEASTPDCYLVHGRSVCGSPAGATHARFTGGKGKFIR
jgi:hypothetical protein